MVGTVTRIVEARGFGFLRSSDHQGDVFFHVNDTPGRAMRQDMVGQSFYFEVTQGDRGPRATNMRPI